MGCATQIWWGGGGPPAHATVRLGARRRRALVTTGIQDIGTGTLTARAMVAAEELGLPLDACSCVGGDTAPNVYGPVAGGSQTTPSVMPAVRAAGGRRAQAQLLELAGDVFEIVGRRPRRCATAASARSTARSTSRHRGHGEARRRDDRRLRRRAGPNPDGLRASTPSAARSRRSRSIPAPARCASSGSSPCTTSAASSTRSAREPGRGRRAAGHRPSRCSEERVVDPTTGVAVNAHARRLQAADASPTRRRSWSSSSTCPTARCQRRRQGPRRAADRPHRRRDRATRSPTRPAAACAALPITRRARPGGARDERLRPARRRSTRRSSCWRSPARGRSRGGTDLAGAVDRGIVAPATARRPAGARASTASSGDGDGVAIGAATTLADVGGADALRAVRGRARTAAGAAASPLLRNQRHRRRQPLPAHALLVLPRPRVALLARRRRHLLRADRRPPQAQPRARRLHLGAPVRPRAGARGAAARRCVVRSAGGRARAAAARALPPADRATTGRCSTLAPGELVTAVGCRRRPTRRPTCAPASGGVLVPAASRRRRRQRRRACAWSRRGVANVPRELDPRRPARRPARATRRAPGSATCSRRSSSAPSPTSLRGGLSAPSRRGCPRCGRAGAPAARSARTPADPRSRRSRPTARPRP